MGLFFVLNLQIYLETSSLQRENVPKLPVVLDYYCENWALPVHDIKSFATSTFLSLLLLKEQLMICDKKNCAREYQVQTRSQSKRGFWAQNRRVKKDNIYLSP